MHLYLSELELEFDFGKYSLSTISGAVAPKSNRFLGSTRLLLPKNVVGRKLFTIKYRMYEYVQGIWID